MIIITNVCISLLHCLRTNYNDINTKYKNYKNYKKIIKILKMENKWEILGVTETVTLNFPEINLVLYTI